MKINRSSISEKILHNGATTLGDGETFEVCGLAICNLQIQGLSGDTIIFEESNDGVNWHATTAKNRNGGAESTTATLDGIYNVSVLAINFIRARISTYSAGTITVTCTAIA